MRQELVKFYQHVIKFSHVSPGFHHHFFWVSTSFSGWAEHNDQVTHKVCRDVNTQTCRGGGKYKGLQEQFNYGRL